MMRTPPIQRAVYILGIFVMSLMSALFRPASALDTESLARQRWLLYGSDNAADLSLLDTDTGTKYVLRTFTSTLTSPTGVIPFHSTDIVLQRLPDGGLLMSGDLNRNGENRIYRLEMPTLRMTPIMDGHLELVLDDGTMIYRARNVDGFWRRYRREMNKFEASPVEISSSISPYSQVPIPGARLATVDENSGYLCIWHATDNEARCLEGYLLTPSLFRSETNEIIAIDTGSKGWSLINLDTLALKKISGTDGLHPKFYRADQDAVYYRKERLGFGKYGFGTLFDLWKYSFETGKKQRVLKNEDIGNSSGQAVWLLDSEVPEAIRKSAER